MTGSSPRTRKTRLILLWTLVALAVLILSVSLSDVRLEPGRRFRIEPHGAGTGISTEAQAGDWALPFFKFLFLLAAVLAVLSLIVHLASREGRRRLLLDSVVVILAILALTVILRFRPEDGAVKEKEALGEPGQSAQPSLPSALDPVPSFDDRPPPWTGWAVAAGLSLAAAAAAAAVAAAVLTRRKAGGGMARDIAEAADEAAGSLRAGVDARNVVIRCYAQMCGIADRDRGVRRERDMTPGEFVALLAAAGIPDAPVRSLTRVFEEVRYGSAAPTGGLERQALDALREISSACRGGRG